MAHLTMVRNHKCTRAAISFTFISTGIQWSVGGDGDGRTYGRVEVSYDGVRGTICDLGWGTADARVLCRQLGKGSLPNYEPFPEGPPPPLKNWPFAPGCCLVKIRYTLNFYCFSAFMLPAS